jgi:hypothetical protein
VISSFLYRMDVSIRALLETGLVFHFFSNLSGIFLNLSWGFVLDSFWTNFGLVLGQA